MPPPVPEPGQDRRRNAWILGGLVAAGALLRLFRLGVPSLWTDELFTADRYRESLWTVVRQSDPFPPLYYVLGKLWSLVAGLSEAALRFPSVVYSALGIVAIYFLAAELFDRRTARLASALLVFSPYSINYAQEAKMFSLFWLLGTVSFFFLCRYLRTGERRELWGYALASIASIYTFYMGFVVLVVENLIFFALARRGRRRWGLAQIGILLAYLPWAVRLLQATARRGDAMGWISAPDSALAFLLKMAATITGNWREPPRPAELALYAILLAAGWAGAVLIRRPREAAWTRGDTLATLALVVPPILFLGVDRVAHHVLVVRYVGFAHIPLIILLARALARMVPPLRALAAGLLIAGWSIFYLAPYYRDGLKIERQDWKGLVQRIEAQAAPDSATVSDDFFTRLARYYVPGIQPVEELENFRGGSIFRIFKGPLYVPVGWDSPRPHVPEASLTLPGGTYRLAAWTNQSQKLSCAFYEKER